MDAIKRRVFTARVPGLEGKVLTALVELLTVYYLDEQEGGYWQLRDNQSTALVEE